MTIVLDASMALAWVLKRKDPNESAMAVRGFDAVLASGAMVPALWYAEVGNALLLGERQRVITSQQSASHLLGLGLLGIECDTNAPEACLDEVLQLGRIHNLTAYDATYLELTMRRAAVLATFDRKLAEAARVSGLNVFGDPG